MICLDKAMAKVRQMEKDVGASPGLKPPAVSPGPLVTEEEADGDDSLEYVALVSKDTLCFDITFLNILSVTLICVLHC